MRTTILYLEDNITTANFVKKIFEHHKISYVHVTTLLGFETQMFEEHYSAILTHSIIEERDMFSFTAYINRKTKHYLPVIAYAGEDFVDNAMRASQANIAYFMIKPFTPFELLYALETINLATKTAKIYISPKQDNEAEKKGLSDIIRNALQIYFEAHQGELPPTGLYERVLHEVEAPLIEISLAYNKGNRIKTAELLGINRNTLRKKILSLGLSDDSK